MWTRFRQRLAYWIAGPCPRCGYPAPKLRAVRPARLDLLCEFPGCQSAANPIKTADGTYRCSTHKGQ